MEDMNMSEKEINQLQNEDQKSEATKLDEECLDKVAGGVYDPDTGKKDDDILLPEL